MKGTVAMLAREIPGNLVYFGIYRKCTGETLKERLLAGAFAGAGFSVVVYPLDALRSQVVTSAKIQLSYKGVGWYVIRVSSLTSVFFAGYETLLCPTIL